MTYFFIGSSPSRFPFSYRHLQSNKMSFYLNKKGKSLVQGLKTVHSFLTPMSVGQILNVVRLSRPSYFLAALASSEPVSVSLPVRSSEPAQPFCSGRFSHRRTPSTAVTSSTPRCTAARASCPRPSS